MHFGGRRRALRGNLDRDDPFPGAAGVPPRAWWLEDDILPGTGAGLEVDVVVRGRDV